MSQKGVLLVNLGSPDSPSVGDVRRYLRQFLMDGRVLDAPWPVRFGIVHFAILPSRPKQSAEAYEKIWLPEGSPLVVTSKRVCATVRQHTPLPVEVAMRYQNPSISSALNKLIYQGVDEVLLIPLFPHYAMSSFETAVEEVRAELAKQAPLARLQVQPPFFDAPDYIAALAASARSYLAEDFDHLLFSFHGLPERHLRKSDPTCSHCLKVKNCCETPSPAHATCYRAQCFKTVRAFADQVGLAREKYSIAFQSRLGRDPWLQPYTDKEIERLARGGVKKLLVMCPAFVTDCLETLEEIGMRGQESFHEAGGEKLTLIPCLNEHPQWIQALAGMIERFATTGSQATPKTDARVVSSCQR